MAEPEASVDEVGEEGHLMTYRVCVASSGAKSENAIYNNLLCPSPLQVLVNDSGDVVGKYHHMYEDRNPLSDAIAKQQPDVFIYVHDDVTIHDHWQPLVQFEFDNDPKVGIVGLGGAIGIGVDDIYKVPYELTQLQRIGYHSNQTDAEIHGKRFEGAMDVAVVDGFFMAIRTELLNKLGGWKWMQTRFHNYDNAMCLAALRLGYKVRMVGVSCTHQGGGTSTKESYALWCLNNNTTMQDEHSKPHLWMYDHFRDLLPYRVGRR